MAHKCFISFKAEDLWYKSYIQNDLNIDIIDKSLNDPIDSEDEDYIMRVIRRDYLNDSTVTICLIGNRSAENLHPYSENQYYIKKELQASLSEASSSKNGILGIVLPSMTSEIYSGSHICSTCGKEHNYINICDSTIIKEFSYNYYIPNDSLCAWSEEDRYCVLCKWEDFKSDPNHYIDQAFNKRDAPIAKKTKVRPK